MSFDLVEDTISQILSKDDNSEFVIPSFQRAYSWEKKNWDNLFDDIIENEAGYFIGSMIMLSGPENDRKGGKKKKFTVIDGQQRLTTISILLCAIYDTFNELKIEFDKESPEYSTYLQLKFMIALPTKNDAGEKWSPRLVLQDLNDNKETYYTLLNKIGFENSHKASRAGVRRIFLAFNRFKLRIKQEIEHNGEEAETYLLDLLERVFNTTVVDITVRDISDAIQIFSTLNNRGLPLSAADIIKTTIMMQFNKDANTELDGWNQLIDNINEGKEKVSDRFFRSFFNSILADIKNRYRYDSKIVKSGNLLESVEEICKLDISWVYDEMCKSSDDYAIITAKETTESDELNKSLTGLSRLDSTTSYVLLLYLFRKKRSDEISTQNMIDVVDYLIKFFVRRNLLDIPQARGIPKLFIDITYKIYALRGDEVVNKIKSILTSESANLSSFVYYLNGPLYEDNQNLTRFILASISEHHCNKEFKSIWDKDKDDKYIWTIEHILPQTLTDEWKKMISPDNPDEAEDIQERCVHKIGNLTLSGNNSSLSNAPFKEKRDAMKNDVPIGYNNGLWLNNDLKDIESWNETLIKERSEKLMMEAVHLFSFDTTELDQYINEEIDINDLISKPVD